MAAELSHIEPGKPVAHEAHHDLESFFYILLGICLLYDNPGRLKPAKDLAECFDPFFAVTQPSTLKTVTIQSNLGWTALMIPQNTGERGFHSGRLYQFHRYDALQAPRQLLAIEGANKPFERRGGTAERQRLHFGTSRMSGDSLQQDPPIRVPGTSSIAGSLKLRSENEPESDSRPAETFTCWWRLIGWSRVESMWMGPDTIA
ncbi:hypothetical protein HD554DRAFT_1765025 [Boletus coccyginus]|nr:hypothetical protein HD554DRAFT_1765025 [Boletus coccyginus]